MFSIRHHDHRRGDSPILPRQWQASWFPLSTAISNIYRWSWTWWFSAPSSNEKNVPPKQIKFRRRRDNSLSPLKFVKKDYVDHFDQIEMRKEKRRTESERQQTQWLEQDKNDIEWEQLYNSDQISSLKVHELNLYLVRHGIVFKGKKPEKVTTRHGERDSTAWRNFNFGLRKWCRGKDSRLWSTVNIIERIERYKWQPCTAYSGHINVKVRPKENTGRPASETVTCHCRTRRKKKERKSEWIR